MRHQLLSSAGGRTALLLVAPLALSIASCGDDPPPEPQVFVESCAPGAACSPVASQCLALVDNADKQVAGLRVSQLTLTKPAVLAGGIVAEQVAKRVELDLPDCHLGGDGTFSWLIEIDREAHTVRTGGAPPGNPYDGYCFVNGMLHGKPVVPAELEASLNEDGTFEVRDFDVTLPIYLDKTGAAVVLLPLRQVSVLEGKITPDLNCIGKHAADDLDPTAQCFGTPETPPFHNGAKLEAYITLEDADSVDVSVLDTSLCVALSENAAQYGDGASPVTRCRRDANDKILLQGDWCSDTNQPDGCRDSFRVGGDLAASAVEIHGDCN